MVHFGGVAVLLAVCVSAHMAAAAVSRDLLTNLTLRDFQNTIAYGYASYGYAETSSGDLVCPVDVTFGTSPQGLYWTIFDDYSYHYFNSPTLADGANSVPYFTGDGELVSITPYVNNFYILNLNDQLYTYLYTCELSFTDAVVSSSVKIAMICNSRRGNKGSTDLQPVTIDEYSYLPKCDLADPSNSIAVENLFFVQGSDAMTFAPSLLLALVSLLLVFVF